MGIVDGFMLDTHVFLWAVSEDDKLSVNAREAIENIKSRLFISAISAFEIGNKYRIGKLPEYKEIVDKYHEFVAKLGAAELPISGLHAQFAAKIEWDHRDPFDRIIVAQAFIENLPLITCDAAFATLPWLNRVW
jgi:PIN domain nuclease of toxin-antitoxin system